MINNNQETNCALGASRLSVKLERRIVETTDWFYDNPNWQDIYDELKNTVIAAIIEEREECAKECEVLRVSVFPEIMEPRERDSHECADAIRMRSNVKQAEKMPYILVERRKSYGTWSGIDRRKI